MVGRTLVKIHQIMKEEVEKHMNTYFGVIWVKIAVTVIQ